MATTRGDPSKPHTESERPGWTINIPGHEPPRESAEYIAARKQMHQLVDTLNPPFYGPEPVDDHHGGGLWFEDDNGWFSVRDLAGTEWSAQFCADPAMTDLLRQNARRLYALFREAVEKLGIREAGGRSVAVAPIAERRSGDGRVQVLYAPDRSALYPWLEQARGRGEVLVLDAEHLVAQAAFGQQYGKSAARRPAASHSVG